MIKLTEIDPKRIRPSGQGILMDVFIPFSERASAEWVETFNTYWQRAVFYSMKRRALATPIGVTITCVLEEIPTYHFAELSHAIEEVTKLVGEANATAEAKQKMEEARRREEERQLFEKVNSINANLRGRTGDGNAQK